jgi:hypothetical protein
MLANEPIDITFVHESSGIRYPRSLENALGLMLNGRNELIIEDGVLKLKHPNSQGGWAVVKPTADDLKQGSGW